jgi:phosphoribosylformylglycinamidine synthase
MRSAVYRARIRITLRPSILDPQGKAVLHALGTLGAAGVADVRMGKYVELRLTAGTAEEARATTEFVCTRLLANPVMEDYSYEVEPAS